MTAPAVFKVVDVILPEAAIVPIFDKLPEESNLNVPDPAPVLMPVVPFTVVPVIVLAVAIVPKPEAIEPLVRAPTVVREDVVTPEPNVVAESTSVPLIW